MKLTSFAFFIRILANLQNWMYVMNKHCNYVSASKSKGKNHTVATMFTPVSSRHETRNAIVSDSSVNVALMTPHILYFCMLLCSRQWGLAWWTASVSDLLIWSTFASTVLFLYLCEAMKASNLSSLVPDSSMNLAIKAWAFFTRATASALVDFSFIKASPPSKTLSNELTSFDACLM